MRVCRRADVDPFLSSKSFRWRTRHAIECVLSRHPYAYKICVFICCFAYESSASDAGDGP